MGFDPSQPFEAVAEAEKPPFDPSQPHEAVAVAEFDPSQPFEAVDDGQSTYEWTPERIAAHNASADSLNPPSAATLAGREYDKAAAPLTRLAAGPLRYTEAEMDALNTPMVSAREPTPVADAWENAKRLAFTTEKQRSEDAIPVTHPDGSVTYEYKPLADSITRKGIFAPPDAFDLAPIPPNPDDPAWKAAGKAALNQAVGFAKFGMSPGGILLTAMGGAGGMARGAAGYAPAGLGAEGVGAASIASNIATAGKVGSAGFAVDMLSHVPEQIRMAREADTTQGRIEGSIGAIATLGLGLLAAKHAVGSNHPAIREAVSQAPDGALTAIAANETMMGSIHADVREAIIREQASRAAPATTAAVEAAFVEVEPPPLPSGRLGAPDPIAPVSPETAPVPLIAGPALLDAEGKIIARGALGDTHAGLKTTAIGEGNADAADAQHGFVDEAGNAMTREAAAKLALDAGQIDQAAYDRAMARTRERGLHSQDLTPIPAPPPPAAGETTVAVEPGGGKPADAVAAPDAKAAAEAAVKGGPGAMSPQEAAEMEARVKASATSNKESVVNQELAAEGFDPVTKEEKIANIATLDNAEAVLESNPNKGSEIVARLTSENPQERTISLQDGAVMLVERKKLQNQRADAAERSVDPELTQAERDAARVTYSEADAKIHAMNEAAQGARSTWGRFGQFWQQMLRDDFTFDTLRRKLETSKGEKLDPKNPKDAAVLKDLQEQAAKHAELTATIAERDSANAEKAEQAGRIAELEKLLAEAGRKPKEAAPKADRVPRDYTPKKPLSASILETLSAGKDALRERMAARRKAQSGMMMMKIVPFDVLKLADEAAYATITLAELGVKGAVKFADFAKRMTEEVGNHIEPHMKALYAHAQEQLERMQKDGPRDIPAEREATVEGMKAAAKDTPRAELPKKLHPYARALARQFIDEGMTEMKDIDAAVHAALKDVIPDITERESGRAWTGYGDWKSASTEPAAVTLSHATDERRAALKLEGARDLNEPPDKTGKERIPTTATARITEREAARIVKAKGLKPVDPAKQLKTALDAVKSRLRNKKEELDLAMATRKRLVRDKSGIEYDAEAKQLKAEADQAQADHDTMFPKEPITEAEQLRRLTVIAERQNEAWQKRRVAAEKGDFSGPEKVQGPLNQRLQYIRDQARAAAAEVSHLRDLDSAFAEQKTQAALDAAGDRLQAIIDHGAKPKPGVKEGPVTAATAAKQRRNAALKQAIADARELSGETAAKKADQIGRFLDAEIAKVDKELAEGTRRAKPGERTDTPENEQKRTELDAMRAMRAEIDKVPGKTIDENKLDSLIKRRDALEKEVASGKIDPKTGRPTAATAEQAKIQSEIDALNERKAAMREAANPKAPEHIRELQKIEDRIADAEDRLARGEIDPATGKPTVDTAEIAAAKAHLKVINETIAAMRKAARPTLSPAMRMLRAERARLTRSIADKTMRRYTGDFGPREVKAKPVPLTPEEKAADRELEALRAEKGRMEGQFDQAKAEYIAAKRQGFEKALDELSGWNRAFKLSRVTTLIKLALRSLYKLTFTPVHEAVGGAYSAIPGYSRLAGRANIEGKFSGPALRAFYKGFFGQGMRDAAANLSPAVSIVTRGKFGDLNMRSNLKSLYEKHGDTSYGPASALRPRAYDIPQILHEVEKSPLLRAQFEMASEKLFAHAAKEGRDIRDSAVREELLQQAYQQGKRDILMGDNRWAEMINHGIRWAEMPDRETKKVTFQGKAGATVLRAIATFNKVGSNHFVESVVNGTLGFPIGQVRFGIAVLRGLENLHPKDANSIMRQLKQGTPAAAMLTFGILAPQLFGGLDPRKKRKEGEPGFGEMKIGGKIVPRLVTMAFPPFIAAQFGATIMHVAESRRLKRDPETQGIPAGIGAAAVAAAETGPLVNEGARIGKLFDQNQRGEFVSDWLRSNFEPGLIDEIATTLDKDRDGRTVRRAARGFWQHVELGIPGARNTLDEKQDRHKQ